MRDFATPCLICGKLARGSSRCEEHEAQRQARRNARPDSAARIEKKKLLYNSAYRKRAKEIRDLVARYGATCYLCNKPIEPGSVVQIDHVLPELGTNSPLAPTHKFCNESKGNKPGI